MFVHPAESRRRIAVFESGLGAHGPGLPPLRTHRALLSAVLLHPVGPRLRPCIREPVWNAVAPSEVDLVWGLALKAEWGIFALCSST